MEQKRIEKGLIYTKPGYEEIADIARETIEGLQHEDARTVSDEYGIYYNALAGLLRAGALCSRVTGTDGFPEIRIVNGSKSYQCREDVMRTILGAEADYIISPYEDKFESYLDPLIVYDIPDQEEETQSEKPASSKPKEDVRALKRTHKKELEAQRKQYEAQIKELNKQLKEAQKAAAKPAPPEEPVPMPPIVEDHREPVIPVPQEPQTVIQDGGDPQASAKVRELEKENAKLIQTNQRLLQANQKLKDDTSGQLKVITTQKEKIVVLTQQVQQKTQALEEREKYHYDPVYDHYYSDELPVIIAGLESTKSDLFFKAIAMTGCVAGIAISALMGFFQFL